MKCRRQSQDSGLDISGLSMVPKGSRCQISPHFQGPEDTGSLYKRNSVTGICLWCSGCPWHSFHRLQAQHPQRIEPMKKFSQGSFESFFLEYQLTWGQDRWLILALLILFWVLWGLLFCHEVYNCRPQGTAFLSFLPAPDADGGGDSGMKQTSRNWGELLFNFSKLFKS